MFGLAASRLPQAQVLAARHANAASTAIATRTASSALTRRPEVSNRPRQTLGRSRGLGYTITRRSQGLAGAPAPLRWVPPPPVEEQVLVGALTPDQVSIAEDQAVDRGPARIRAEHALEGTRAGAALDEGKQGPA